MKIRTIDDLQSLIDNEIEESTVLDYKSTIDKNKPNWKEELAKDVSAMANANGGVIVYGIMEKAVGKGHSVPEKLTPISNTLMSKDSFSQLLSSNIQPVIENVEINYIPYNDHSGFFVVEVPQGITAHQNRLSRQYHRRRNAIIEAMEDYEIRDVMNRNKHPLVGVEFTLVKKVLNITERKLSNDYSLLGFQTTHKQEIKYELQFRLVNMGRVYAKYINCFIHIPLIYNPNNEKGPEGVDRNKKCYVVKVDNTIRDAVDVHGQNVVYGPSRYDPLLPGVMGEVRKCSVNFDDIENNDSMPPIWYSVMADNAPERRIEVEWKDIKTIEKPKSITRDPIN